MDTFLYFLIDACRESAFLGTFLGVAMAANVAAWVVGWRRIWWLLTAPGEPEMPPHGVQPWQLGYERLARRVDGRLELAVHDETGAVKHWIPAPVEPVDVGEHRPATIIMDGKPLPPKPG